MLLIPIKDDNPTTRPPIVTIAIIAANVLVFLYQLSLSEPEGDRFIYRFGMIPALLLDNAMGSKNIGIPPWATIFTSMYPIFQAARDAGALGVFLSGGGPTIAAFVRSNADDVALHAAAITFPMMWSLAGTRSVFTTCAACSCRLQT